MKGAIITALSGVIATKDDIERVIEISNQWFQKMDERFAKMDERFAQIDDKIDKLDGRFTKMEEKFDRMNVIISSIYNREGKELEQLILNTMKETLRLNSVDPDKIRKVELKDPNGIVFAPGFITDIYVLLENGNTYLVEVKAKADSNDIYHFFNVAKLFEAEKKVKPAGLIVVSLRINSRTIQHADKTGIKLIVGEIIPN